MSVRRRSRLSLSAILLSGAGVLLPGMAAAQATSDAASNETTSFETIRREDGAIIVTAPRYVPSGTITASKTTAPLIETPASVSVVSRDQIDLLSFIDVQQAVRYTAGVVGENYGPDLRFDFLTQRGFTPVQYIDGLQAPISATIPNVGVDLYGFQAIDILKGPASVLYGSSPPGGLYNLTSRRPSAQAGGELQVKYGTDDYKQAAGTVTGELTDGVTARLTGLYRDRDSQVDFVHQKRAYVAPAVTVDLGPDTQLTGLGYYQWERVRGDTNGFLPFLGVAVPNPVGRVSRSINLGEPDYNFYRRRQWSAGYELTHRFSDALRFTQNARWGEYHEYQQVVYGAGLAADNRTVSRFNFPSTDDVHQFAIDSRFDATLTTGAITHRLLAGFDYRNYREASGFGFAVAPSIDLFNPVYGATATTVPAFFPFTDQRLRQAGLYVQDQARVGDFILTLSGRQDWTRLNNYASTAIPKDRRDKFTYRVGGTYVTEAGIAPYVSYATSFQPVVGQSSPSTGGGAFAPSTGKQWEAGVKYDARGLGDDVKLFATAAAFRIRQSNVVTPEVGSFFQVQVGEVLSKGVELEVVGRIREQLSINASYTYTDAKTTESAVPAQIGARLPAQPRHKATLFVDYTLSGGPLAGFGGGGGVRYLSRNPGTLPGAFDPLTYTTQAVTLFDAQLHYDIPGWRFGVNGSNLFDKRYAARCNGPVGCIFGQRRQILGTVTKKF